MIPRPKKPAGSRHDDEPIRFPADRPASRRPEDSHRPAPEQVHQAEPHDHAGNALAALAQVSRRINDLARELRCLGYFDDGDDRPRAA